MNKPSNIKNGNRLPRSLSIIACVIVAIVLTIIPATASFYLVNDGSFEASPSQWISSSSTNCYWIGDFSEITGVSPYEGAKNFCHKHASGVVLLGNEELDYYEFPENISVYSCSEAIKMTENPIKAVKEKPDSSLVRAAELVVKGIADVFISPGNTGASVFAARKFFGKTRDGIRPAITAITPNERQGPDNYSVCLDLGANYNCTGEDLFNFAKMGSAFYRGVFEKAHPKVAVFNMGTEDYKGPKFVRDADRLLREADLSDLEYLGFREGTDLTTGEADVIVFDGFTGNNVLKTVEGLGNFLKREVKEYYKTLLGKLTLPALLGLKRRAKRYNPELYGGAMLLGVNKPTVISHGSSSPKSIESALAFAERCAPLYEDINSEIAGK